MRVFSSMQTTPGSKVASPRWVCGKKHDFAAGTSCIHGGLDKRVAADGEDDGIGSAALGLCENAVDDVFAACMDGML